MPPINIDIGRFFGSEQDPMSSSMSTHKNALESQVQKDLAEQLKETANSIKRLNELQQTSLSQTGEKSRELEQMMKSVRIRSMEEVQDVLQTQGMTHQQARSGAQNIISSIIRNPEGDVNEALDSFSKKMEEVSRRTKDTTNGFNNLITALGGGFGGGMFAQGMIAGNPIRMAEGALIAGSSMWQGARMEGIGGMAKAGLWAGVAGAAALADYGMQLAPQAVEQSMTLQRSLIRGGNTELPELMSMGSQGGLNVLNLQQKSQMADLFTSTGGGTSQQLAEAMNQFSKYTLVYGESAMSLMQASRRLDMWVPRGEFSKDLQLMTSELKSKGFSPELIQEQIQALTPALIRQSQMGRSQEGLEQTIQTSGFISTKLGMGGAQGVQAIQGFQGIFKNALQNPSLYAFLTEKAKISRTRALQISNGDSPSGEEITHIADALKDAMRGVGGGIEGLELQRAMLNNIGESMGAGGATTEAIARSMGISAGITPTRSGASSENKILNKILVDQQGSMQAESIKLQNAQDIVLKGLTKEIQQLAASIYSIQGLANKMALGITEGLVKGFDFAVDKTKGAIRTTSVGGLNSPVRVKGQHTGDPFGLNG